MPDKNEWEHGFRGYLDDIVDLRALATVRLMFKVLAAMLLLMGGVMAGFSLVDLQQPYAVRVLAAGLLTVVCAVVSYLLSKFLRPDGPRAR